MLLVLGSLILTYRISRVLYPPQMRGEAEAFAIGARARAEAEQMAKKAEAFQLYQEAAQLDMLLEKLPQVWGRDGGGGGGGHMDKSSGGTGGNEGPGENQARGHELGAGITSQ